MPEAIAGSILRTVVRSEGSCIDLERNDPNFSEYQENPESRPFRSIRAFRTSGNGKDLPGVIMLVKNKDGSVSSLKGIMPSFFAQKENQKLLNSFLKKTPNWAFAVMKSGSFLVTQPLEPGVEYKYIVGEWYVSAEEVQKVAGLFEEWKETGNVPEGLEEFIFLITLSLW